MRDCVVIVTVLWALVRILLVIGRIHLLPRF